MANNVNLIHIYQGNGELIFTLPFLQLDSHLKIHILMMGEKCGLNDYRSRSLSKGRRASVVVSGWTTKGVYFLFHRRV